MVSPTVAPIPPTNWRRLALISLFVGMGFALGLAVIFGAIVWYDSRPTPQKPWNRSAIIAKGPPGFNVSTGEKRGLELSYSLENSTDRDYRIENDTNVTTVVRTNEGILSEPLPKSAALIRTPIFIPAKQKAFLTVVVFTSGIPERGPSESDSQYHENLRRFLEDHLEGIGSFSVFDESNRYEIDLPRWLPQKPKEE